jgi:hypothetical protein
VTENVRKSVINTVTTLQLGRLPPVGDVPRNSVAPVGAVED